MGNLLSSRSRVIQTVTYGFAPFFAYPFKPLLNVAFGGGYPLSYKHFRAQHMDGNNLFYHVMCLVWQLSSNYALLGSLDETINERNWGMKNILTFLTSVIWALHLSTSSPTPLIVKAASLMSIFVAHKWAGPLFAANWRSFVFLQGFVEAAAIQLVSKGKNVGFNKMYVAYILFRTILWKYLSENEGMYENYSQKILGILVLLITALAATKNPISKTVSMGLYGWAFALLAANKTLYFYSCGMMATLCQGVAHAVSGEAGTLVVLEASQMDTAAYELSHTVFFPNLVFQACFEHLGLA